MPNNNNPLLYCQGCRSECLPREMVKFVIPVRGDSPIKVRVCKQCEKVVEALRSRGEYAPAVLDALYSRRNICKSPALPTRQDRGPSARSINLGGIGRSVVITTILVGRHNDAD